MVIYKTIYKTEKYYLTLLSAKLINYPTCPEGFCNKSNNPQFPEFETGRACSAGLYGRNNEGGTTSSPDLTGLDEEDGISRPSE